MKKALPLFLLVGLLVGFRLVGAWSSEFLPGFEPLSAVFFCVAACVGLRWLWIPLVAWVLSYPLTNEILGYLWDWQALIVVGGFALAAGLGWTLRNRPKLLPMLGGALGAGLLFYFVTNIGSWALLPYQKTWAGFVQAQTIGLTGRDLGLGEIFFPPAWVFLKNGLLANLLFTGLFLLGQRQWGSEPDGKLVPVRVRY